MSFGGVGPPSSFFTTSHQIAISPSKLLENRLVFLFKLLCQNHSFFFFLFDFIDGEMTKFPRLQRALFITSFSFLFFVENHWQIEHSWFVACSGLDLSHHSDFFSSSLLFFFLNCSLQVLLFCFDCRLRVRLWFFDWPITSFLLSFSIQLKLQVDLSVFSSHTLNENSFAFLLQLNPLLLELPYI